MVTSYSNDQQTPEQMIIALEKSALRRWISGDPSGFIEISAPEVTYQDPFIERRIDGLEALKAYYEPIKGKVRADDFELLNPLVQVHGDMAALTFNYVSWNHDQTGARRETRWNCTEVYARIGEKWRIVHTHWSLTQPKRQQ
jgi:hypothetical protein